MFTTIGHATPRRLPVALLLGGLALLLAGCFRIEVGIRVNDDGSGALSMLMALDVEAFEQLGGGSELGGLDLGENPFADFDESDLPPGASVEEYEEDGFSGVRLTVPFEADDDIASTIDDLLASTGDGDDDITSLAGGDAAFEEFTLRRDGEGWLFDATVGALNDSESDDAGAALLGEGLLELLFADASFSVRMALPGEVIDHNADEVDGDELVWNLDLFEDEPRQLRARTGAASGDSNSNTTVIIVVVALLAVAAVATLIVLRARSSRI
jgi:hypothetical protein